MPVPTGPARYWELRVPVSSETSEGLTNFLWELGALGVAEESLADAGPYLRAFYPATAEPSRLSAAVIRYADELRALGMAVDGSPEFVPLVDEGWAEAWREHFRPLLVGDRLVVAPPWEQPAIPGRRVIVIEPARAFGTGHHPTTRGCLEMVERLVASGRPARAIDLGTGSGILAVSAAVLGVSHVVAIDSDPDAVAAAQLNAAANGVAEHVECLVADAGQARLEPAPLIMANLLTAGHLALAARYAALVTPGGYLVLGGILEQDGPAVGTAVTRQGFAQIASRPLAEWTTLVFTRPGHTPPAGNATIHGQR